MLKSMAPRTVCLFVEEPALKEQLARFFADQGWLADATGPNDLVVYDGPEGLQVLRWLRERGNKTPALLIRRDGMRVGRVSRTLAISAPFSADVLRDACGALLRRAIPHVPKRRAS